MTERFEKAIKRVGALFLSEQGAFFASIQPQRQAPKNTPASFVAPARFTLYAVLCAATEALEAGMEIAGMGRRYVIESIETYMYRGRGLYRKGTLADADTEGAFGAMRHLYHPDEILFTGFDLKRKGADN